MVYLQRRVGMIIRNYNISKLYTKYLFSPYRLHIKKNPAKLIAIISQDTPNACAIIELIVLILREIFVILFITFLLLLVDPLAFSLIFGIFFLFSVIFIYFAKIYSFRKGAILQKDRLKNFSAINETFESIKDIKILKKEDFFLNRFYQKIKSQEKQKLFLSVMNVVPRFGFEMLTILIIFFVIMFSSSMGIKNENLVAIITFLAFSSLRLIPAFKTINVSLNSIIFNLPSLNIVLEENDQFSKISPNIKVEKNTENKISFESSIILENITFSYERDTKPVLRNINLEIKKGEKIGLVGPSGSGKTTLINCLLGLLDLNEGKIKSDGMDISANFNDWKNYLGYVPQDIYLLDDTVKKNIGFGLKDKYIDNQKIERAIDITYASEFVKKLPLGINTIVGNRGIGLSGGQKQRLGIARAIYDSPDLLLLDEATNALDEFMEKNLLKRIFEIKKKSTILVIAHRIVSLENCDKLIYLENGIIKDIGSYDQITNKYKLV